MKRVNRILVGAVCVVVLLVSWAIAVSAKSDAQKQEELLAQARALLADEVFIRAVPLLEEAATYREAGTVEAEEYLKEAYVHLLDQKDYTKRYTKLLETQMQREDAKPEVFLEAANFYLGRSKLKEALAVLRDGIGKTGDEALIRLYEDERYQFCIRRNYYYDVTEICNGKVQVRLDGGWGLADSQGRLLVPCEYEQVSSFSNQEAIVKQGGVISGVDEAGNRVALLHTEASDFKNYAQDRLWLKLEDGWHLANGEFVTGSVAYEDCGMFSNGAAPAKLDGKWGLVGTDGKEWILAPEFDDIIQDELGRAYAQEAIFVRQGGAIFLVADGKQVGGPYEDAEPFADSWAAVKQNGKWGFIDREGTLQLECEYSDAKSFSQGVAAVRTPSGWGYISLLGEMVIEPEYLDAKSFSDGSAPVRTEQGWLFISLVEYEKEGNGIL